jgi:single-stranded-DNA-specific exonuclease
LPLDLLIPGLLTDRRQRTDAQAELPRLERWLARADVARDAATSAEAWLARRFGLEEVAVAPVTLAVDEAPQPGTWLRADPVYIRVEGDTLVLHSAEILAITPDEARALVAALRDHFSTDGLEFRVPRPTAGTRACRAEELPVTTPLAEALGADVFGRLPRGSGRINWPSAITEIQMLFASHPVNLARESERRLPINAVWFWGGGTLPQAIASPYGRIYADETFASGLAHLSATALAPLPPTLAGIDHAAPALAVVERIDAETDAAWFAPLGSAIARFGSVRLVLPGRGGALVATLTPAARWRLFRPRAASRPMPEITRRAVDEAVSARLAAAGCDPRLARLFAARGVSAPEELGTTLRSLVTPERLAHVDDAARLLADAIESREPMLIVADYDADGATACAVGMKGLAAMGATVSYLVPNRFEHSYGISPEIVAEAAKRGPKLLITVDNGIAAVEGIDAANRLGMRVLVTDHHLPGPRLPEAACIVNPNQPGCGFPSKHLAGVGVMFYVLTALRAELRRRGAFATRPEPNLAELLDLVALGTVADVARLDANNRVLVTQGLARIRAGRASPGVAALLAVAGRSERNATVYDLGFSAGPRLNAAGRLDDMSLGIECLLATDAATATRRASDLDRLNLERRGIEDDMQASALKLVAGFEAGDGYTLALHDPEWHAGVVGILASRLKERFHRPVFAFARDGTGDRLKARAARSPGSTCAMRSIASTSARRACSSALAGMRAPPERRWPPGGWRHFATPSRRSRARCSRPPTCSSASRPTASSPRATSPSSSRSCCATRSGDRVSRSRVSRAISASSRRRSWARST